MRKTIPLLALPVLLATAAVAHPGGHAHMSWLEIIQHYAEPDHLAFLAATVIVGWLAYRHGRRVEARAQTKPDSSRKDSR